MSMEFSEAKEVGSGAPSTGAKLPDLRIGGDNYSSETVAEPAVTPRDYRAITEPGQGAPELRETAAHIPGHPLVVDYGPVANEEMVPEPSVRRPRAIPQGALNISRPDTDQTARHRDDPNQSGQPAEGSASDATSAHEEDNRETEVAAGGGDVPPTDDPPETAQAGEFGDDENNSEGTGSSDSHDPLLEDMRAAQHEGVKPNLPHPRQAPDDIPARTPDDVPVTDDALQAPVGEFVAPDTADTKDPTDAEVREAVDEFINEARYGQQTGGDESTADIPDETDGRRKNLPSHFPSDEEIRDGIAKINGAQNDAPKTDSEARSDERHTDGIPNEDIDDVLADLTTFETGNRMEGRLGEGDVPPGHDELADQEEKRQANTDKTPSEEGSNTNDEPGFRMDITVDGKPLSADDVRRVVDGPEGTTSSQTSDSDLLGDDPVGEGMQKLADALEGGLRPLSEDAAKEVGSNIREQDKRDFAQGSPDGIGIPPSDTGQNETFTEDSVPPEDFMALNDLQDVPGPGVDPTEFNRQDDTPPADGTEAPENGPETSDNDLPNLLPSAQQTLDFIDEYRRLNPEATAPGTELGDRLDRMEASIYEAYPHLSESDSNIDEQGDKTDLPGVRGLESQLGSAVNEGYTTDKSDVFLAPNSKGVPEPSEHAPEVFGTDSADELPRRERTETPIEGYTLPNVDPEALREIIEHLRNDTGDSSSSSDHEQGNEGTPPTEDNPEDPEAG